jgi:hypothetical protein
VNFSYIVEHIAFDKRASYPHFPIKMGIFPQKWENSHKKGNFSYIIGHVAFDLRASCLHFPIKMGTFP